MSRNQFVEKSFLRLCNPVIFFPTHLRGYLSNNSKVNHTETRLGLFGWLRVVTSSSVLRVTSHDLTRLNEVDGFREWREKEAAALSALVQHRLHILQNPPDCASAKKIYCDFKAAVSSSVV